MTVIANPVAIDNTTLNSFAVVRRMDLLQGAFGECHVVDAVVDESRNPGWLRGPVDTAIQQGWLKKCGITVTELPGYAGYLSEYFDVKLLGKGESASLAWIRALGGGTLVTDDRNAATEAMKADIRVVSTLWVLYHQFQSGVLTDVVANELIRDMRQPPRNAKFPPYIVGFGDVVKQFEKPQRERRLF